MALKVPEAASLIFLNVIRDHLLEGATLRVYQNNYTPINTSVVGDFTEATFDGYGGISLSGWPDASLNADLKASTQLVAQNFEKSAGASTNTVYGIYVTGAGGNLLWAERNPAGGIVINTEGQIYAYLPRFTDVSEV